MFSGLSKHTPYPVNSLKLKKILLEQMNNNKSSKGHGMQSTSRSSSSGGSTQSETNYSKIVNKVERIKIEDENNGNSPRTASVTPTNNEPSTIGSNAGITDEDKHNGNNVNKSNEPETRYVVLYFFKFYFSIYSIFCSFIGIEIKIIPKWFEIWQLSTPLNFI